MKSFKFFLSILSVAILLFGCDDPEIEKPDKPVKPITSEALSGQFQVNKQSNFVRAGNTEIELEVEIDGEGVFNKFGASCLKLHHREIIRSSVERKMVTGGKLILWNDDGDEIYGKYGSSSQIANGNLKFEVSVNGGNGRYLMAIGILIVELVPQGLNKYLALVKGTVHLQKEIKPPVL